MAWRKNKKEKPTPEEELDTYKKDIGNQYMDGLISDKEYEELLLSKTRELGLEAPQAAAEGPECPSCGALVDPRGTVCNICDAALEPALEADATGPDPEISEEEPDRTCAACNATVSKEDTICTVCGATLPPVEDDILGEEEAGDMRVCPECGAYADSDAAECLICETPIPPVAVSVEETVTEEEPVPEQPELEAVEEGPEVEDIAEEPIPDEPEVTEEPAPEEERVCPECGAYVDSDAAECLICDAAIPPVAVSVEETAVTEGEPESEPVEEAPEVEGIAEEPVPDEPAVEEEVFPEMTEIEEPAPEEEAEVTAQARVCPECGAFSEPDAEECKVCKTNIAAVPVTTEALALGEPVPGESPEAPPGTVPAPEEPEEPELEPVEEAPEVEGIAEEPVPDEPEVTEEPAPEEERVCPECGAYVEADATECMICDTPLPLAAVSIEETEEEPEEIILEENEIICPSCTKVIPVDSGTCPECWTDLSLYVICPSCSLLTPAGETLCRECFASLAEVEEEYEPTPDTGAGEEEALGDIDIPDEDMITEEVREEMTVIETQEEQGKECLVCFAILESHEDICPICGIEYGVEVEEPEMPEEVWEVLEVEIPLTVRNCPNCGSNVTGLDATDREINENKWFFRGLVAIFTGIFFTSFSMWARGINVESASLGMRPPPTDVVMNLVGWIMVLIGFVFWFISWRFHEQRDECPECGVETESGMELCINCGVDLMEPDQEPPEEEVPEEEAEEEVNEKGNYLDGLNLPRRGYQPTETEEPDIPHEELEVPEEPEIPAEELDGEPEHFVGEELPVEHEEHKKCPGCGIFVDLDQAICPVCDTEFAPEPTTVEVPEGYEELADPSIEAEVPEPPAEDGEMPDTEESAPEPPTEDEELAQLDIEDVAPEPPVDAEDVAPEPPTEDEEPAQLDVEDVAPEPPVDAEDVAPEPPTEDEEPAQLDIEDVAPEPPVDAEDVAPEPTVDEITLPDASAPSVECPSCGADLEPGTKECPICEYVLED